jgi:two-component system CheB/CheR fusion protein
MVVFARQNFVSDPPFSRMDLVSCRNLLIYLQPSLQQKLIPVFHYALRPEGFLFLGASESIGTFTDLFEAVDKKNKIYSKKAAQTPGFQLPVRREHGERQVIEQPRRIAASRSAKGKGELDGFRTELNSQREADRVTINRYSPPGVLVNGELQILQFRGPTGPYLEPPTGKASFDVLKMARQGLMLPLRAAINKAKKENKTTRRENVRVGQNGATRMVNIEVVPLKNLRERHFLVLFEDANTSASAADPPRREPTRVSAKTPVGRAEYLALQRELTEMRDYLQSVLEQHDAANEELQASNEEVQSANEELQSINEELETSKEELESANEELTTVNEEMANRNTELNRLNNDMVNLQTSTKLAILLLGRDLTIRRFSAQAERQFSLLPTDIGKSIHRAHHSLDIIDLAGWIEDVIDKLREREREVRDKDGRWYLLRARPYLTVDNKVDGAVLVLVNIDELKRTEQMVRESEEKYRTLVDQVTDYAIFRMDLAGRATTWNEGVKRILGFDKEEFLGKDIVPTIFTPEDVREGVADKELRRATAEGSASDDRWLQRKDGTRFFAAGITSALTDDAGGVVGFTKIFRDTTEQKQAEEALWQADADLRARAEELARFNRIAVGRETRMIELKKEINELHRRLGEPTRYPLEFENHERGANG